MRPLDEGLGSAIIHVGYMNLERHRQAESSTFIRWCRW